MEEYTADKELNPDEHTVFIAPVKNHKSLIVKSVNENPKRIRIAAGDRQILQKHVWLQNVINWLQSLNRINRSEVTKLYLKDEISGEIEEISFCKALDLITVK